MADAATKMDSIERFIIVAVAIGPVFEQWSRVEDWPLFLKAFREVRRVDEKRFHLKAERSGIEYEALAEISLLIPDKRIAWRTVSGAESSGVVSFEGLPDDRTQVNLKMQYRADAGWNRPEVLAERLEFHLACFKEFIEKDSGQIST